MNAQRKKIIMTEINYWKQNKLLPEHYCDFLITLYTQGEEDQDVKLSEAILVKEKKNMNIGFFLLTALSIGIGVSMFVFIDHPTLTLSLAGIVLISMLLTTLTKRNIRSGVESLLYILSAFLLLGISLKIWIDYFEGQSILLVVLLTLNCLLWLFAGRLLKIVYFTISGGAGLLIIIGFLFKIL